MAAKSDGQVVIEIDADASGFETELDKAKGKVKDTEDGLGGLGGESEKVKEAMAAMTAAFAAASVALVSLGAKALGAASDYEAAFAKTQTIMDDTVVSIGVMNSEILDLSRTSAMAAGDVSEAVYQAISGSVDTANAVGFVNQANQLAVAGFTSLTNATDVLTTTLNAYGLSAESVDGISNVLIQTQNLGKTSVDELSSTIGKAIATGSAYGVNLENISTAYVEMTRGGIATAEATTYLSGMLNELGKADSEVAKIIREETGKSFGELMASGASLGDALQILSSRVDGNAEAMMGLWGSQEAGKAANALMTQGVEDFNSVVAQMKEEMQGATGTTEKAYETMTDTSEFIDRKLNNSVNNLGIAFGSQLSPAVDLVKKGLTGLIDGFASFISKSPAAVAIVTGLTVVVLASSVALAAYTLKAKLATSATLQMTAAMLTNPVFLLIAAVAGLTVGIGVYAAAANDAQEETEELTAASEKQRQELDALNAEYETLCESGRENSTEAALLKKQIEEETAAFEAGKQTLAEYNEERAKLLDAQKEATEGYENTVEGIETERNSTESLIEQLNALSSAEKLSNSAKQEMLAIIDILNERIPELGLKYDELTGKVNLSSEELEAAAAGEYARRESEVNYERLITAKGAEEGMKESAENDRQNLAAAQATLAQAQAAARNKREEVLGDKQYATTPEEVAKLSETSEAVRLAEEKVLDWEAALATSQAAYDANKETIDMLTVAIGGYTESLEEATTTEDSAVVAWTEASATLEAAYNEAYNSARQSIEGQMGLFENMGETMTRINGVTQNSAQEATAGFIGSLDTQIAYLDTYTSNMELAASRGIDQGLLQHLSDGSAESAEILANLVQATDEQIQEMNEKFSAVGEGKDKFAEGMVEYTGVVQTEKDAMVVLAESAGLDMSQSMTQELLNGLPAFEAALRSYGSAVNKVSPNSANAGGMEAYASGTSSAAAGYALVGELGPELVYFHGGERVLTAEETRAALETVYPTAPALRHAGAGLPAIAGGAKMQLVATIAVPVCVDGREFARTTAEYVGEEMEFGVM